MVCILSIVTFQNTLITYILTYFYLVDSVRELERSERRRLIFHGIVVSELVVAVLGGSIFSVKKLKCRGGGVMGTTHNLILNTPFFLQIDKCAPTPKRISFSCSWQHPLEKQKPKKRPDVTKKCGGLDYHLEYLGG